MSMLPPRALPLPLSMARKQSSAVATFMSSPVRRSMVAAASAASFVGARRHVLVQQQAEDVSLIASVAVNMSPDCVAKEGCPRPWSAQGEKPLQ